MIIMSNWVFYVALMLFAIACLCAWFIWKLVTVEPEIDDEYIDYYDDKEEEPKP